MSPNQFEFKWKTVEDKITSYFVQSNFSFLIFLTVLSGLSYLLLPLWQSSDYPAWARLNLAQDRYWASLTIIIGSLFFYFIPQKITNIYLIFILCLSWFIPVYLLDSLRISSLYPILYILINSILIFKFKEYKKSLLIICTFLFLILVVLFGLDVELSKKGKLFQYFSLIHFEMLFFYFIQTIYQQNFNFIFNFNPLQLYSPIPIPAESEFIQNKQFKKTYFVKGMIEIAQSVLLFSCLFISLKVDFLKRQDSIIIQYVVFLFFVIAVMKSLHGILWLFGFKTPSATHFVLLAKSPLETWQRGSTFVAKFIFNAIYFPLWKAFRSQFFAVTGVLLFVFFHLFILHDILLKNILILFFPAFQTMPASFHQLSQQLIWFLVWFLWIMGFMFSFQRIEYFKKSAFGQWLLIVFTHIGNMLIMPLGFYLTQLLI